MPQQIETTQTAFRDALAAVAPIVEPRNTIPILGAVLIEDGYIRSTNLDVEIRAAFGMSGKIETPFAIQCRQVANMVRHIDDGETIKIENDGEHRVSLAFNGSKYSVISYQGSDFPDFTIGELGEGSLTGSAGIMAAIKRVLFAVSNEEVRYYLHGVCILTMFGKPYVVATDGYRAAFCAIPFVPTGAERQILPRSLLQYLVSRKAEPERMLFATAEKPRAIFDFPGLQVKAKLIDGTYPDVEHVVPKNVAHRMTFDRIKLLAILRRMDEFVSRCDGMYGRPVKLIFGSDKIELVSNDVDLGTATETFTACQIAVGSEGFTVGFNLKYLIEALSAFHAGTLSWAEEDAGSPVLLTGENDGLSVVCMPMRV